MSQLLQLRAAVIDAIRAALPKFNVEGHLGRFAAGDLSKFLMAAPAVRVAVLGLNDGAIINGEDDDVLVDATARLAVYVVTKDQGKATRDEIATAAVEVIVRLAAGAKWGLPFAWPALAADASNLFSDETLNKGVALWGINIPQPIRLWSADDIDAGGPLTEMFIGIAPEVGVAHIGDYVGPFVGTAPGDIDV